jgi:proteasome lid subunit RPN8/RPN11
MVELAEAVLRRIKAHMLDAYPEEGCGFIVGLFSTEGPLSLADPKLAAQVIDFWPAENAEASARNFSVPPKAILAADKRAAELGAELVGVVHSHTHTEAFPSPTDIGASSDPSWFLMIVSLRHAGFPVRAYRILDGKVIEVPVVVTKGGKID